MARIGVVVAPSRSVLGELVTRTLRTAPDIEVLAEASSVMTLLAVVREQRPQVVVLDLHDASTLPAYLDVLVAFPRVVILAIVDDGRNASLYEMRPRETRIGELGPRELIAAIRSAILARPVDARPWMGPAPGDSRAQP